MTDDNDDVMEKINSHTSAEYSMGLLLITCCAFFYSIIIILTRKMKDVHFSLVMFHYGFLASIILIIWIVLKYVIYMSDYPNGPQIFTYDAEQWKLLITMSVANAVGMNL